MLNEGWLWLSAALLACGIIIAFVMIVYWARNRETPRFFNGWTALVLVALAAFVYYMTVNNYGGKWYEFFENSIASILDVARSFQGENSLRDTHERFDALGVTLGGTWQWLYDIYAAVLHFAMSAALFSVIYKVAQRLFSESLFSHTFRREAYIFSTISERTLLLAEDIFNSGRSASLIFLNKNDSGKETDLYMMTRVKNVRGKVLSEDPARLRLPVRYLRRKEKIEFFLLDENETENCYQTFDLIGKYKNTKRSIVVNLLAHSPEATTMLANETPDDSGLIIRPIDEYSTIIRRLANTSPFFLGKREVASKVEDTSTGKDASEGKDASKDEEKLTILIVGAGRIGMTAVKLASWCAQTINLRPEILVVDSDPRAESRFAAECPELCDGDDVTVKFFTCDITGDEFVKFAEQHTEVGYVIVSLGDDMLTLHAGRVLRTVFERKLLSGEDGDLTLPLIHVKVRDEVFSQKTSSIDMQADEYGANMRNLYPFGSLNSIYKYDIITNLPLDRGGAMVRAAYNKKPDDADPQMPWSEHWRSIQTDTETMWREFWGTNQYNRNSSTANALHAKYKAYAVLVECGGKNIEKIDESEWKNEGLSERVIQILSGELERLKQETPEEERRPARLEKFAELEHRRWSAYMRSTGWRHIDDDDICKYNRAADDKRAAGSKMPRRTHKFPAARLHGCIRPWDELEDFGRYVYRVGKDGVVGEDDFRNNDFKMVIVLPEVLRAIAGGSMSFGDKPNIVERKWNAIVRRFRRKKSQKEQ